jgi:hypothetical protein
VPGRAGSRPSSQTSGCIHMADALHRRRWLSLHLRQLRVNAGPGWRAGRPDGHRRTGEIRVVECSGSNEDQVWPGLGLAEQRCAARAAETTMHSIAAVCDARKVTCFSRDLERRRAKAGANRSAACAQVLTVPAPTNARNDWRLQAFPANRTAEAPASYCHRSLQSPKAGKAQPTDLTVRVNAAFATRQNRWQRRSWQDRFPQ